MSLKASLRIVGADRIEDDLIVSFSNGKCALYDAALLYAMFAQAKLVADGEPELDD